MRELEASLQERGEVADKAQELVQLLARKEEDLKVTLRVKETMLVDQSASISELKGRLTDSEARATGAEFLVREMEVQLERQREQQEAQEGELRRQKDVEARLKNMIASYHDEVRALRTSVDGQGDRDFDSDGASASASASVSGLRGLLGESMEDLSVSRSGAWSSGSTSAGREERQD